MNKSMSLRVIIILFIFISLFLSGCSNKMEYENGKREGLKNGEIKGINIGLKKGYQIGYTDAIAGKEKKLNLNYLSGVKLLIAFLISIVVLISMSLSVLSLIFISGSDEQKIAKIIGSLISLYLWFRFIYPELAGIDRYGKWNEYSLYIEFFIFIGSMGIAWVIISFIEASVEIGNLLLSMMLIPTVLTGLYFLIGWKEIGAVMGTELFAFRIHGAIFVGVGFYLVGKLISED